MISYFGAAFSRLGSIWPYASKRGLIAIREEREQLLAQLRDVGRELTSARVEREQLLAQLHHAGRELIDARVEQEQAPARLHEIGQGFTAEERQQLLEQLRSVGKEATDLRAENDRLRSMYGNAAHEKGVAETKLRYWRYMATRFSWQTKALQAELFGPPNPCPEPPREIPAELMDRFTLGGKVAVEPAYYNGTYPSNYPLIYTDQEIDEYIRVLRENLGKPAEQQDWFIYGTLDRWTCEAIQKYPIAGKAVVNMGSLTPWYESMFIYFGAHPVTIDYNPLLLRTSRMSFMSIDEWERDRPRFDVGFSISSFEHDGLGMYGDPIDPDGDLKAMRKMKDRIKPDGLLFLAVPTGKDKILYNSARVYGRHRLPMLMAGWEWIDNFGFSESDLDGNGSAQPLYVLRNV